MSIYDDVIKKMIFGMPGTKVKEATKGLLGRGGEFGQGKIQGLLGSDNFRQGLGLISAGFRGKGLQEALFDAERIKLARAKRMSIGIGQGKLVDVFDVQQNKNVKIDERLVRFNPNRYLSKKSAGEIEKAATRTAVLGSIEKLKTQVKKQGSGLFEGFVKGLASETGLNSKYAKFKADTKQLELNVIKALRGAQVSAAEEANVRKILPSIYDTESVYLAKLESLREYLQKIDVQIKGGALPTEPASTKKTPKKKNEIENDIFGVL
tara:strand:- start:284 stop:1078 length:795 start_codon:yes stop_codon:yes gene_type:complete